MTTQHNPYATATLRASTSLKEYVDPMEEESPRSSTTSQDTSQPDSPKESQKQQATDDAEIPVEEEDEPLPPSYHRPMTEETLRDDDRPYVFWASIRIPIPEKPDDPVTTMLDYLQNFMVHMLEADAHFTVFPHNLSTYETLDEMPEPLEDPDHIPGEVDEWLEYFPGARPRASGGNTYTLALLGFREPFPTVIKATALWLRRLNLGYGNPLSNPRNQSRWDGSSSQHLRWRSKCYKAKSHCK